MPLLRSLFLLALGAAPLVAQQADSFVGRVEMAEVPVAGVAVTLHRVTADSSGVVASTVSDPAGQFRFRLPPPAEEGFTVFFTTADYLGVRYFGLPLHPGDPLAGYSLAVFDTAAVLPDGAVRVAQRDLVLLPHSDGGWEVNEVVRLVNGARRTLVPGSRAFTWEVPLPAGVEAFEAGEGDIPADRVRWMGDRLFLDAPLTPGGHEVFFRYRIPAGESEAALQFASAGVDSMNVFVRQPSPRLEIDGMRASEILEVEGNRFLQFTARAIPAGGAIRMDWEEAAPPVSPVWAGVGSALLLLLVGAAAAIRARHRAPPARAGAR